MAQRYGEDRPPIVDPLLVRDTLINRLGSLFVFDISKQTWGGRVEPVRVNLRENDWFTTTEALVIGGDATFGTEKPGSRHTGFIQQLSPHGTGSYFIACDWDTKFDLKAWLREPRWTRALPLQFLHLVPEPGVNEPLVFDLDLLTLSTLGLTTFSEGRTEELKQILDWRHPPKPDLFSFPYY